MRFTISMHEMEPKALKAPLAAAIRFVYMVYMEEDGLQQPGWFPFSFREVCEFFEAPCIGLVMVERLGQWFNVPTQGWRVAQTGTKPFSLTAPGSDPQPGIKPRPHWWETDVPTTRPPEHTFNRFIKDINYFIKLWHLGFLTSQTAWLPVN